MTIGGEAVVESKTLSRTGWWSLLPRFEETLRPEFFRFTGKVRLIVVCCLLVANGATALQVGRMRFDEDAYWMLAAWQWPTHVLDGLLALWLWRGRLSSHGMRRATYGCMALETSTTVLTMWVFGSVSSHMIVFAVVLLLIYRLAYDFRIGLTAFAALLVGHWGLVIAEMAGLLPAQPIAFERVDHIYQLPDRELGAMVMITIMMATTFVLANWAVARMRFKEMTIRLLREQLIAAESGRIGRHSGRTLVDTYLVGALIGVGGMGEVYRGEHQRTRRQVAIKLLHPHLLEDISVVHRFRREAEATGRVDCEHIVHILDVDEDEGQPFLVFEYLDGESLATCLARERMPLATIDDVVRQLALGLDAAHRAGVVHRDLKPDNIYLCRRADGSLLIKVLDFGVSKLLGDVTALTREMAILGTPDYMSPEQAVGLADAISERSDLFALGAILYTALTGAPPFASTSVPAQLRRICDEEPVPISELRPDLPAAVAAVVAIAMAKRPDERYASAGELAADLTRAIAGTADPGVARRAAAVGRGRPASRSLDRPDAEYTS